MITIPQQVQTEPILVTGSCPKCGIAFRVQVEAHGTYVFNCPSETGCTHRIHVEA